MPVRSHDLGFASSWKMLTRDKGWVKPLLVLTIVGWIPVLGQIALLGYGLEWARLTAWGVDSAPKQSGVKYGKVLRTGAVAFLVALSMSVVLSLLDVLIFGSILTSSAFPALAGTTATGDAFAMIYGGRSIGMYLILLVVNLLFGTFISVAMMRATVYDSFTAGWRLDRIFQMIGRDVAGFFRVYLVSLIAGIVNWLYSVAVSFIALMVVLGGVVGFAYMAPELANGNTSDLLQAVAYALVQMGPTPVLALVLVALALAFVGGVIGTAMELVTINAVGQWFCRFDVGRWGVSGDPLPEGVPVKFQDGVAKPAEAPVQPAEAAQVTSEAAASPVQPEGAASEASAGTSDAPAPTPSSASAAGAEQADDAVSEGADDAEPAAEKASESPEDSPEAVVVDDGHPMGPLIGVAPESAPEEPASEKPADDAQDGASAEKAAEKDDHGPWDEVLHPEEFKAEHENAEK